MANPPQYVSVKLRVLKFRLGTYLTPLKWPPSCLKAMNMASSQKRCMDELLEKACSDLLRDFINITGLKDG